MTTDTIAARNAAMLVAVLLLTTAATVAASPVRPAPATVPGPCSMPVSPHLDMASSAAPNDRSPATRLAYPQPACPALRALADTITTSPCDTMPGRYDLIRYRQWRGISSSGEPGTVWEILRWTADDLSDAQLATEYPPGPMPVSKDWWHAGHVPPHIPADLILNPQLPFVVHALLRHDDGRYYTPADALRAVADLASWHTLRRADRATALTTLAQYNELVGYRRVSHRAGRVGVGITATDNEGRRGLLVVHPITGDILAYETARPDPAGGWRAISYRLFLGHSRVDARWWEPPGPPPSGPQHRRRTRNEPHLPATPCLPMPEGDAR
ncbi:hypothetical protein [Verrucosispora sp. ts21]|uniref:hypothetical protein n=1 Tax=Verrucosispora sp. ts21 TaxID=2069341 RepID=UPI0011AECA40|nr:hypothetical protein [Verrucosispora sp. ts21]